MRVGTRKSLLIVGLVFFITASTFSQKANQGHQDLQLLADNVFSLSEVMLHDVANPPAASRFYAYALLGAYETAFFANGQLPNINLKLKVNPGIRPPAQPKNFNLSFTANYAMLDVGRQLMPSGALLKEKQKHLMHHFTAHKILSERSLAEHVLYAQAIAMQIVQYARADDYNKLSTYTRYTPSKEEGHWYPTPPEYMAAIEPRWRTVRSFFLDSANQFAPNPPTAFSKEQHYRRSAKSRQLLGLQSIRGDLLRPYGHWFEKNLSRGSLDGYSRNCL